MQFLRGLQFFHLNSVIFACSQEGEIANSFLSCQQDSFLEDTDTVTPFDETSVWLCFKSITIQNVLGFSSFSTNIAVY